MNFLSSPLLQVCRLTQNQENQAGMILSHSFSVDYTETMDPETCDLECDEGCRCQLCVCCSVCSEQCKCSSNILDLNEKMQNILGFGDENYRFAQL